MSFIFLDFVATSCSPQAKSMLIVSSAPVQNNAPMHDLLDSGAFQERQINDFNKNANVLTFPRQIDFQRTSHTRQEVSMSFARSLLSLALLLSALLAIGRGQEEIGCFVTGECTGGNIVANYPEESASKCLADCQQDPTCSYFSFFEETGVCSLYETCDFSDACTGCVSGDSDCSGVQCDVVVRPLLLLSTDHAFYVLLSVLLDNNFRDSVAVIPLGLPPLPTRTSAFKTAMRMLTVRIGLLIQQTTFAPC